MMNLTFCIVDLWALALWPGDSNQHKTTKSVVGDKILEYK